MKTKQIPYKCPVCNGKGEYDHVKCKACDGKGLVWGSETETYPGDNVPWIKDCEPYWQPGKQYVTNPITQTAPVPPSPWPNIVWSTQTGLPKFESMRYTVCGGIYNPETKKYDSTPITSGISNSVAQRYADTYRTY